MASSASAAANKYARLAEHLVAAAIAVGEGLAAFMLMLFVFSWGLAMLAAAGIVLVLLRELFFYLIPTLIDIAVPAVFVINLTIGALDVFSLVVTGAFDIIVSVLSVFHLKLGTMSPLLIKDITVDEYVAGLKFVATQCAPYTTAFVVWEKSVMPELSSYICPYIRMMYPVWDDAFDPVLVGFVTADADPYGNSCAVEHVPPATTAVCTSLAAGFLVLEVLLPLLLIGLFLWTAAGSLRHLAYEVVEITFVLTRALVHRAVVLLKDLDAAFAIL